MAYIQTQSNILLLLELTNIQYFVRLRALETHTTPSSVNNNYKGGLSNQGFTTVGEETTQVNLAQVNKDRITFINSYLSYSYNFVLSIRK